MPYQKARLNNRDMIKVKNRVGKPNSLRPAICSIRISAGPLVKFPVLNKTVPFDFIEERRFLIKHVPRAYRQQADSSLLPTATRLWFFGRGIAFQEFAIPIFQSDNQIGTGTCRKMLTGFMRQLQGKNRCVQL